jgi:hypothetical protein
MAFIEDCRCPSHHWPPLQLRQGVEAQQRNPLHAYHTRVRLINYDCYFFEPITAQELDKVGGGWVACS